jgi:hypothetical protein
MKFVIFNFELIITMRGTGILLKEDYDLAVEVRRDAAGRIAQGLMVGNATHQNQALILLLQKGELKLSPLTGAGVGDMVNDHDMGAWKREITEQIEADGQRITKLDVGAAGLTVEAHYK